jgi:hypothetical protein
MIVIVYDISQHLSFIFVFHHKFDPSTLWKSFADNKENKVWSTQKGELVKLKIVLVSSIPKVHRNNISLIILSTMKSNPGPFGYDVSDQNSYTSVIFTQFFISDPRHFCIMQSSTPIESVPSSCLLEVSFNVCIKFLKW